MWIDTGAASERESGLRGSLSHLRGAFRLGLLQPIVLLTWFRLCVWLISGSFPACTCISKPRWIPGNRPVGRLTSPLLGSASPIILLRWPILGASVHRGQTPAAQAGAHPSPASILREIRQKYAYQFAIFRRYLAVSFYSLTLRLPVFPRFTYNWNSSKGEGYTLFLPNCREHLE